MTVDYGGCPVTVDLPSPEVLAEQERCAVIAEKQAAYWLEQYTQAVSSTRRDYCEGAYLASMTIASLVRSGK